MNSMRLEEGDSVRYNGDLPEGWSRDGTVLAVIDDASGDQVATVLFGDGLPGFEQDILASELELEPNAAMQRAADAAEEAVE